MPISSAASGSSRSDFHATTRPRGVDEIHRAEHEQEHDERRVVVAVERADVQPREVPVVDAGNAVRAAREVVVPRQAEDRDAVAVLHDGNEELPEEEGDDREVVAEQTP